jgi:hypothetical protein
LKVESPRFRTYIVVESGGSITSDVTQRVLLGHVDFGGKYEPICRLNNNNNNNYYYYYFFFLKKQLTSNNTSGGSMHFEI